MYALGAFGALLYILKLSANNQKKCDAPAAPNNAKFGVVLHSNYSLGDEINYQCNHGYQLTGYGILVCTKGHRWRQIGCCGPSGIQCNPPNNTTNGVYQPVKEMYNVNDLVSYSCNSGYGIEGYYFLTCLQDGAWSYPTPNCTVLANNQKPCDAPAAPNNAKFDVVLQGNYSLGDEINYQCNHGYQLTGYGILVCTKGHQWRQIGYCGPSGIQCNPPNDTVNGNFQPVKEMYNVNDTVSYSCNSGYGIEGYYLLTCLQNGAWSYPAPNCTVLETPQCVNGSWTMYFFPYIRSRDGTFANLNQYCRSYPDMCPKQLPSAVDIIYENNRMAYHYRLDRQIVHVDPQRGLSCLNSEQIDGRVCNIQYGVRFCLPIPEGPPPCSQKWTRFLEQDNPSGTGDWEGMVLYSTRGALCQNYPTSMDVRLANSNEDYRASGRKLKQVGAHAICINDYEGRLCPDLKVRFCCQEIACPSGKWTQFFNLDSPDGDGDYEMIVDARTMYPTQMCSGNVTAIDARNINLDGWGYSWYARPVHMDTNVGFWCINDEHLHFSPCHDYRVRFCCE